MRTVLSRSMWFLQGPTAVSEWLSRVCVCASVWACVCELECHLAVWCAYLLEQLQRFLLISANISMTVVSELPMAHLPSLLMTSAASLRCPHFPNSSIPFQKTLRETEEGRHSSISPSYRRHGIDPPVHPFAITYTENLLSFVYDCRLLRCDGIGIRLLSSLNSDRAAEENQYTNVIMELQWQTLKQKKNKNKSYINTADIQIMYTSYWMGLLFVTV